MEGLGIGVVFFVSDRRFMVEFKAMCPEYTEQLWIEQYGV